MATISTNELGHLLERMPLQMPSTLRPSVSTDEWKASNPMDGESGLTCCRSSGLLEKPDGPTGTPNQVRGDLGVSSLKPACKAVALTTTTSGPEESALAGTGFQCQLREATDLAKLVQIDGLADGVGITKDTVVALLILSFVIRQSCEGHFDWRWGSPWVNLQPKEWR